MPSSRKSLEIDAGRVFRWSFLVAFLLLEWIVWMEVRQIPIRRPGHRLVIFLLAPWATRRAAKLALFAAVVLTLAAVLVVRLVVAPLFRWWLCPAFDPSSWMFHLSASESPTASAPARFRSGGRWQPGALVLTDRRIWFMPAAWDLEPWSMARDDLEQVQAEPVALAGALPLRHWPELMRFTARTGDRVSFAVSDPDAVLAWFPPARTSSAAQPPARAVPEGVFDV